MELAGTASTDRDGAARRDPPSIETPAVSFFRTPHYFAELDGRVNPALFKERGYDDQVRVWVPGCRTGEEAYSAAILLYEYASHRVGRDVDVQIFATDADAAVLDVARTGWYGTDIAQQMSTVCLEHYFTSDRNGYRVNAVIRDIVMFAEHDLLEDAAFPHLDLIICRDILAGLPPVERMRVLDQFHYALNPSGFLLLGDLDTEEGLASRFTRVSPSVPLYQSVETPLIVVPVQTPPDAHPVLTLEDIHYQILGRRYGPPGLLIDEHSEVLHSTEAARRFMGKDADLKRKNLVEMVAPDRRQELKEAIDRAFASQTSATLRHLTWSRLGVPPADLMLYGQVLELGGRRTLQVVLEPAVSGGDGPVAREVPVMGLVETLTRELSRAKTVLETSHDRHEKARAQLQSYKNDRAQLRQELGQAREALRQMNSALRTLKEELGHKEAEVQHITADLDRLMEADDEAVLWVTDEGSIKYFSPPLRELINMIPFDIGRKLKTLTGTIDTAHLHKMALKALGTSDSLEEEIEASDGRAYRVRFVPFEETDEAHSGVLIHFKDLSDARALREARQEADRLVMEAIREAPLPMLLYTDDGTVLQVSKAWAEMSGYDRVDLPTMSEWMARALDGFDAGVENEEALLPAEDVDRPRELTEIRTKDGARRVWAFRTFPFGTDATGRLLTLSMAVDRTEQEELAVRRHEVDAEAAYVGRTKDAFLTNISHEIRTPLTSIIGFADILADKVGGRESQMAQHISNGGLRLLETVNSILRLSSLEGNVTTLNPELLDLTQEAQGILQLFRLEAEEKGLSLRLVIEDSVKVWLDRVGFRRVLTNLVGNAVKFTRIGSVTILIRLEGDDAVIMVEDTGIGISEEFLPHIFEKFTQESDGEGRSYEGSGIGLTIARHLVTLMGGSLDVESEKGEGTSFIVRFSCHMPEFLREVDETPAPGGVRDKVLVVEDNADTQELIMLVLQDRYEVDLAASAEEAIRKAEEEEYQVVLMDISLGVGGSGIDVLHELRALPRFEKTPIVAVTAYAVASAREELLKVGFNAYLPKPFTREMLYKVIESAIDA